MNRKEIFHLRKKRLSDPLYEGVNKTISPGATPGLIAIRQLLFLFRTGDFDDNQFIKEYLAFTLISG